jgi:hypothetical protein
MPLQAIDAIVPGLGHGCFLPNPFQFIRHSSIILPSELYIVDAKSAVKWSGVREIGLCGSTPEILSKIPGSYEILPPLLKEEHSCATRMQTAVSATRHEIVDFIYPLFNVLLSTLVKRLDNKRIVNYKGCGWKQTWLNF